MRGRIFLGGAALAGAAVFAAMGAASGPDGPTLTTVPSALPKAAAYAPASQLSPELRQTMVAQGSMPLENPQGIIGWYGYENDAPSADNPALPQMVPAPGGTTEAQKTEPDKNTYLVLENQTGADPNSAYGTHFLFQGHEAAARDAQGNKLGYITRINLDADTAHRVTLLASKDVTGAPISTIDGSTWDPWAHASSSRPRARRRRSMRPRPATRPRWRTSRARSDGAATRASRTTPPAISGSSRTSGAR
jgi:hypothetical protein